jgi:AraC-like DNA-binding protein
MAVPKPPIALDFDPALLPSGTLWLPRASLSGCLRGAMVRNTVGADLSEAQRLNHFPATPLCCLSWWFTGCSHMLEPSAPGQMGQLADPRRPLAGRWTLSGPFTRPATSWNPGPVHGMMVLFLPDALHALTGLEPARYTDQLVDAATVLSADWLALCEQVQNATDDAQRMDLLESFLAPRWQACRPGLPLYTHRFTDWVTHLAQRAAVSGPGRSLRQLERRVKRWAGLPLRELRGFARSEQAFFDAVAAQVETGNIRWVDVAADSGYADQSHLCRTTRRITGFSPEALSAGIEKEEAFWAYRLWM